MDAVRAYSATADAHGRASRKLQIREADEAIKRANADLDDTIRQLGELGLLGGPASQETLEKLTKALDDAHTARARLGDGGESDVIGPDDIDKLARISRMSQLGPSAMRGSRPLSRACRATEGRRRGAQDARANAGAGQDQDVAVYWHDRRPPGTRISYLCGRVSPGRSGARRGCDGVFVEPSSTDGLGDAGIGSTAGEREGGDAGELA